MSFHVNLTVEVRDENGGNVYAVIFDTPQATADIFNEITSNGVGSQFTKMTPQISTDNQYTDLYVDIHNSYNSTTAVLSSSIEVGQQYYAYLYMVDGLGNGIVVGHANNGSLIISVEGTEINKHIQYLFDEDYMFLNRESFSLPFVTYQPTAGNDYVGYHTSQQNWETALYANVSVNPGEFVVSKIYSFAFEEEISDKYDLVSFVSSSTFSQHTSYTPPYIFDDQTTRSHSIEIKDFCTDISNMNPKPLEFGRDYHIYTVIPAHGFDHYRVMYSGLITSGTKPIIHNDEPIGTVVSRKVTYITEIIRDGLVIKISVNQNGLYIHKLVSTEKKSKNNVIFDTTSLINSSYVEVDIPESRSEITYVYILITTETNLNGFDVSLVPYHYTTYTIPVSS